MENKGESLQCVSIVNKRPSKPATSDLKIPPKTTKQSKECAQESDVTATQLPPQRPGRVFFNPEYLAPSQRNFTFFCRIL